MSILHAEPVKPPEDLLKYKLQANPDLAWEWHCRIAQANMESGYLKWKESNEAACRVMKQLFDVDTSAKFIELLKTRAPKGTTINV